MTTSAPTPRRWKGDGNEAILYHPVTDRIYAVLWHDGYGKYHQTVYLSLRDCVRLRIWREGWLWLRRQGWLAALWPCPCLAFTGLHYKGEMEDAMEAVETFVFATVLHPIPRDGSFTSTPWPEG